PPSFREARLDGEPGGDPLLDHRGHPRPDRAFHSQAEVTAKMIPALLFGGRKVALFGLGGSGLATALSLVEGGAEVSAWDDNPESVARASAAGIPTADLRGIDWSQMASFVL